MRVVLIHGMARSPLSMAPLAARLKAAGHQPSLFGYSVTFQNLDAIAERFAERVRSVVEEDDADDGDGYAVVGHSLGNVITRMASPELPDGFRRFAMLAPPNHSPATARALEDNLLFNLFTQDTGPRLCDEGFFDGLPRPSVPSLVVAGTRGVSTTWHPAGHEPNDGLVSVDEAQLDGVPLVEVPAVHSFLPWRRDVADLVRDFLRDGASVRPTEQC